MTSRRPGPRYVDPLDLVWQDAARRLGLQLVRGSEVFAATDGAGTLTLGTADTLDPDDCLAQMILHECCHWLVQGEASFDVPDWGLDNESERDVVREHACLRTQAALLDPHGLRAFLAPTTDFRAYYDELLPDPLAGTDESVGLATRAVALSRTDRFAPLHRALARTRAIADLLGEVRTAQTLWSRAIRTPSDSEVPGES